MQKLGLAFALVLAGGAGMMIRSARPGDSATGLGSIKVPAGFEVELAVKPGLVNYPMLGTIDDRGRLFLCESSGKTVKTPEMSADPNYIVSMLEDTDGDGVYDKSTVFADKLTLPAGAVFYQGSLYVAAPPRLYKLTDTNGDGVADKRETVVEGWNLSANAASLHGPIMGPDGMLYLTDGRHGFKIDTKDGRHYEGKASRIWRIRPDGTGLDVLAGGGFDNPVEVVFTEAGDVFGTMTYFTDPRDGMRDSILHYVEGGVYPKPYPVTEEFQRTGDLMPVMTKFARIAPSGLLRYRSAAFGARYQGNLFSAQFNSHRVQRHVVSRDGATFKTQDTDFFTSSDPDLHPTDVMEDADGSLLVLDTGAWFIHGCPLSRVAKPDVKGAIYRIRRTGAKVADPRGAKLAWAPRELPALLDDARPAVADRAIEKLVEAGAVPALSAQRKSAKTLSGAAAAVFALYRIGGEAALAAIREALTDLRPEVRQAAARQLGMARDTGAAPALIAMLEGQPPFVRRQVAAALGQIGDRSAAPALLEAAATAEDRFVEHSVIYSLIQLRDGVLLGSKLNDPRANVRKASLIAMDQMEKSALNVSQLLPLLSDEDAGVRRAAVWVASRHAAWSGPLSAALVGRLRGDWFAESEAASLQDAFAAFCDDTGMRRSLGAALGNASLDATRQLFLLDAAERCSSKEFPSAWTSGLERLLLHSSPAVRLRAIQLLRARGVGSLDAPLARLADDPAQHDDIRVAALSALGARRPTLNDTRFSYLVAKLLPNVEAGVKLAAAQVLGRAQLSESQMGAVAKVHFAKADPLVLPNVLDVFRNGSTEAVGRDLVKALEAHEDALGVVGMERVKAVLSKFPQPVSSAAKGLLDRMAASKLTRLEKLKRLASTLSDHGDALKGRELFFGAKTGCSSCHTIGMEGGHVGPDLTSIGAIRSKHDLLEAIVLPSESFVPGHEVYRVETAKEMYSGVLGKSTPDAVRLITGPGDEVRIPRKEIVKMGFAPVSLMPEGFDEVLNREEMTNLMAYLRSQTARPGGPQAAGL